MSSGGLKTYYDVLGVPFLSDEVTVKQAYRKLAVRYHPDKNSSEESTELFRQISDAHTILTDPQRRKSYNLTLQQMYPTSFPEFQSPVVPPSVPLKSPNILHELEVSIQEFYVGKIKTIKLARIRLCPDCEASPRNRKRQAIEHHCTLCSISSPNAKCPNCGNDMLVMNQPAICPTCKGSKYTTVIEQVQVRVQAGMKDGQSVTMHQLGEWNLFDPNAKPGDLIVVFREKTDENSFPFSRQGDNLLYLKTLTLSEALTGFQFILQHLDQRLLLVSSLPKEIIKPGDFKVIDNEGMPIFERPNQKGCLILKFEILFPTHEQLAEHMTEVQKIFPSKPVLPFLPPSVEVVHPRDFPQQNFIPNTQKQNPKQQQQQQQQKQKQQQKQTPQTPQRNECAQM